ncbi:MAG TPA: hypothetical protein VGL38_09745 [bacterium]|jgi:hypothetical protein
MSALQFLQSGGVAQVGGDLPNPEKERINKALTRFALHVRDEARARGIPAEQLRVLKGNFLFSGKDLTAYHVVLVESGGITEIRYLDLTKYGKVDTKDLAEQIRQEIGRPVFSAHWSTSLSDEQMNSAMQDLALGYLTEIQASLAKSTSASRADGFAPNEIHDGISRFLSEHGGHRTAFLMMKFTKTKSHEQIARMLKDTLAEKGIIGLRADDKQYMDELFPNIKVYMHGCNFGIAVFEQIQGDEFNPNVTLEVGYMLGMGKDVLLLKDNTLKDMPSDLIGRLYRPFDTREIEQTLPPQVRSWLLDKGLQ